MADLKESRTPWRCEVDWHAHTSDQRGATCRPDTLLHPELSDEQGKYPPQTSRPNLAQQSLEGPE
ncbi:hypothetical protein [Streptomyces tirandamycinicus]|uniref:Uncharacterized protein n=1 Tax=Streptomyces tirandamycinicus TaxID=2174846 RepID=A0A2S1T216_9ACTN|nr:hypothetical protein [Streptomyces tirandamycinicus]AWI32723.1 hypothetical protein DDW44_30895 [Streptomyces tirandamycinicus]